MMVKGWTHAQQAAQSQVPNSSSQQGTCLLNKAHACIQWYSACTCQCLTNPRLPLPSNNWLKRSPNPHFPDPTDSWPSATTTRLCEDSTPPPPQQQQHSQHTQQVNSPAQKDITLQVVIALWRPPCHMHAVYVPTPPPTHSRTHATCIPYHSHTPVLSCLANNISTKIRACATHTAALCVLVVYPHSLTASSAACWRLMARVKQRPP